MKLVDGLFFEEICGKTDDQATLLVRAKGGTNQDQGTGSNVLTQRCWIICVSGCFYLGLFYLVFIVSPGFE